MADSSIKSEQVLAALTEGQAYSSVDVPGSKLADLGAPQKPYLQDLPIWEISDILVSRE